MGGLKEENRRKSEMKVRMRAASSQHSVGAMVRGTEEKRAAGK